MMTDDEASDLDAVDGSDEMLLLEQLDRYPHDTCQSCSSRCRHRRLLATVRKYADRTGLLPISMPFSLPEHHARNLRALQDDETKTNDLPTLIAQCCFTPCCMPSVYIPDVLNSLHKHETLGSFTIES